MDMLKAAKHIVSEKTISWLKPVVASI